MIKFIFFELVKFLKLVSTFARISWLIVHEVAGIYHDISWWIVNHPTCEPYTNFTLFLVYYFIVFYNVFTEFLIHVKSLIVQHIHHNTGSGGFISWPTHGSQRLSCVFLKLRAASTTMSAAAACRDHFCRHVHAAAGHFSETNGTAPVPATTHLRHFYLSRVQYDCRGLPKVWSSSQGVFDMLRGLKVQSYTRTNGFLKVRHGKNVSLSRCDACIKVCFDTLRYLVV